MEFIQNIESVGRHVIQLYYFIWEIIKGIVSFKIEHKERNAVC